MNLSRVSKGVLSPLELFNICGICVESAILTAVLFLGMWIATGQIVSSMPSLSDVRRGSFGSEGWSEGQIIERERRASLSKSFQNTENPKALGMELRHQSVPEVEDSGPINSMSDMPTDNTNSSARVSPFDNGYQFPPKHTWGESTKIFLVAFWKFFTTPIGFLVTIYGLNVVSSIRVVKFCLFQTFHV